ncbi:alpha/beta hydrolase [Saccharopolyspora sp. HNM0983]|uniref:Alpha/beta hydrolase n=1 Tax=Saccharopolyspora montiporae TaxID=2781240 RepID=A0A929BBK7_9PSEU|nr:alpha/beta family hydrolase [Saccharopolyspora sp. HNM0983]MBE9375841.1 alpha/beta hydrolase [Saccharopolyspora sp. HNM0983]
MTGLQVATPHGPARVELHCAEEGRAALLLGHGAGGGVRAPDLVAATRTATAAGVHVALVEQPYRVAGRRAPAPARQLDAAWLAVVEELGGQHFANLPLIFGGRSSGARVACRTADPGGASAVLCLAFPVHPPGKPEKSRMSELDGLDVPALVVQGERDAFGQPTPSHEREVVLVPGDHALKADAEAVSHAVGEWFARVLRLFD